jgi:Tfp pilus assembly protein PilZ
MSSRTKEGEGLHVELPVSVEAKSGDGSDRRRHPRLQLGLSAHCQIDGVVSQEALGDLSVGGLYLHTSAQVRIGARVRVVLGLPHIGGQRVCSLSGTVVWIDRVEGGKVRGAGVEFDHETDRQDHEVLRGFLALWGTPAPRVSPAGA